MDEQFKARILECVERALSTYGRDVAQVIFWELQTTTGLARSDIAREPTEFVKCIYRVFGPGAATIEKRISDEIGEAFQLDRQNSRSLVQEIEDAKMKIFRHELIGI